MSSWNDIENLCKWTDEGLAALADKQKFAVAVVLKDLKELGSLPAAFDGDKTITLNNLVPMRTLSSFFVHEMGHARTFKLGKALDPKTSGRDDFVKEAVEDEFRATCLQLQHFLRLDLKGQLDVIKPITMRNSPPAYFEYKRSFEGSIKRGGSFEAGLAQASGIVRFFINSGGFTANGMKYRDFYNQKWLKANPNKRP
jgi:hypothetical protein